MLISAIFLPRGVGKSRLLTAALQLIRAGCDAWDWKVPAQPDFVPLTALTSKLVCTA